jgi:hypothetical protein
LEPAPILTLSVAMIKPSLRTLLVPAIGASALLDSGLLATGQAAIALSAITLRAKKEHRAAFATHTSPQPEDHFAVNRHAPSLAALDNGDHFVAS